MVDASGRRLSFTYFDAVQRGANSGRAFKPEAFDIAGAISSLPTLLRGEKATGLAPLQRTDRSTWFTVGNVAGRLVCAVYVDHPDAGSLTWDEARRLANGIARLPELLVGHVCT